MSLRRRRNHLIWIGPVVSFFGLLSYFYVFARFPTLRDFPWVNLPLVLLGLALSGFGVWRAFARSRIFKGKILGSLGFVLSLGFAGLLVLYVFRITYSLPPPSHGTLEMTQAPDFALTGNDGKTVRLSDYRGRKVALIFYRGFW